MGGSSSSSVTQKYDTNIVNRSDINVLNQQINDFVANTVVNQAAKCSQSVAQLQTVDLSSMSITGDLTIDSVDQTQSANVTFDCVQVSAFKNDIANGVMDKFTTAIANSYDANVIDKLNAAASTSSSSGFANTAGSTDSSVNVDYKFTSVTDTHKNLQNILKNSIANNLNLNDIQDCVSQVKNDQKIVFAGTTVGGSVKLGAIKQNQAATLMTKCVQQKNIANAITNQIISDTGITVKEESTVKKDTSIDTLAKSEAKNSGLFESVGQGLKSAFEGLGSMFSGLFGGLLSGYIGSILSCCLVICCILSIVFGLKKFMSGPSSTTNPPPQAGGFFSVNDLVGGLVSNKNKFY